MFKFSNKIFKISLLIILILTGILTACEYHKPELKVTLPVKDTKLFLAAKQSTTISIKNEGVKGSWLAWRIYSSADWLHFSPVKGVLSTSKPVDVKISLIDNLPSNAKETTVYIEGNQGGSFSFEVAIACSDPNESCAEPKLKVIAPQPLIITKQQTLEIINDGEVNSQLVWEISSDQNWLTINPKSGVLEATTEEVKKTVELKLADSLPKDARQGKITIKGGRGGSKTLEFFLGCVTPKIATTVQSQQITKPQGDYVANQLIIRYKEGTKIAYQDLVPDLENTYYYRTIRSGYPLEPDLIAVSEENLLDFAEKLSSDPRVVYAEPNYYLDTLDTIPNDTYFKEQWHLQDFGVTQAWDIETGDKDKAGQRTVIAILDSAIQTDHEDLQAKMLPGCDFYDNDSDPSSPNLNNRHGTHVAGIAAAIGNNNLGVAGVAFGKNIKILPVKNFDDSGQTGRFDDLARAIRWAVGLEVHGYIPNSNPAQILNLSLGAPGKSSVLDEAVADAVKAGAIILAASGNKGFSSSILTPANSPGALAIGSVNSNYQRSSFSNYDNTGGKSVDLMAPGGFSAAGAISVCAGKSSAGILSTFPNNNYGCEAGTSMATPFVAGVAALLWQQNPNFSAKQVQERLFSTTLFKKEWQDNGDAKSFEYGFGVVCVDRALGAKTLCGQ